MTHVKARHAIALVITVVLATAAMATATVAGAASDAPAASEVGVTASEIHIAVVADVDNPLAPGLFAGARYGVEGAAKYLNSKAGGGGIEGRKLVVDFIDSKLNPNSTRNAVIAACSDDFAMVGTSVIFMTNAEDMTNCQDKAGAATGLPDMAGFVAGTVEGCAPTAYAIVPTQVRCDTATETPQTYTVSTLGGPYLVSKFGKNKLHGLMVYSTDTKGAEQASRAGLTGFVNSGIKADQSVGVTGFTQQSGYTTMVQTLKADQSNVVNIIGGAPASLRSEMEIQGVDLASVTFLCGCYASGDKFAGDPALDGVYTWQSSLPFQEASSNAMLRTFEKYVPEDKQDQYSNYAWAVTLAFADAAKATIAKEGVNGLTRANFLKTGVPTLTKFDASGMIGTTDIANRVPSKCGLMLQLKNEKYVRLFPKKTGTFDCQPANSTTFKADFVGG